MPRPRSFVVREKHGALDLAADFQGDIWRSLAWKGPAALRPMDDQPTEPTASVSDAGALADSVRLASQLIRSTRVTPAMVGAECFRRGEAAVAAEIFEKRGYVDVDFLLDHAQHADFGHPPAG
jgi:hypothetical protein